MKWLGRLAPDVEEYRAEQVKVGWRLAAGKYQAPALMNVSFSGEIVLAMDDDEGNGLVYIVGCAAPGYAWTLYPHETVMIEKGSVTP